MARVKLKEKESSKLIGQAIFKAWDAAIEKNPRAPVIDREALIKDLNGLLRNFFNKKFMRGNTHQNSRRGFG